MISRPVILHDPQAIREKIQRDTDFSLQLGVFLVPDLFKSEAVTFLHQEGVVSGSVDLCHIDKKVTYQQLLWEVCSSSYLRPIEKITNCTSLIPDPFINEGGIFLRAQILPFESGRHIDTHLLKVVTQYLFLADTQAIINDDVIAISQGSACLVVSDYQAEVGIQFNEPVMVFCNHYYQNK